MIGFIIAIECALALVFLAIYRRFRGAHGRHELYSLFRRLRTTPGQEQVLREALSRLRNAGRTAFNDTNDARPQLAEMMRADTFDEPGAKTWFAARQKTIEDLKPSIIESLRDVHSVLDTQQRAILGDAMCSRWATLAMHRHSQHRGRWC